MGIIGDGDNDVVMVAADLNMAVVIWRNLSICMFGGGICGVVREVMLIVVVVVILFPTITATTTNLTIVAFVRL